MEITTRIDEKVKIVTEASVRRHLMLEDSDGSTLPVESHHTPIGAPSTSPRHLSSPPRSSIRQDTKVPQPSSPTHTHVVDEVAHIGVHVRHGGAATTVTSLDTGQGSGNIDKTPSIPHDIPLLRVNTLRSDEDIMSLQELTILCTTLSQKVESLETDLKQTKQVYGVAYTKIIIKVKRLEKTVKTGKAKRKVQIVVSDDEEEFEDPSKQGRSMIEEIDQHVEVTLVTPTQVSTQGEAHSQEDQHENQLGVLSAAKVVADTARRTVQTYTRRRIVSTGNGRVSTASRMVSTVEESVSTIGASMLVSTVGKVDKVKKLSFDEIKELFEATMRSINDFVPMESEDDKAVPKLPESRSSKRGAK
uniref:Uncharacterized protein n=1 Tax=Tanacetum cinerariifolium TaxID=118510 RepID=A0A6L2LSN8_TANCI|nr:hypothetical protein [Tanacetum cinerariifolium]